VAKKVKRKLEEEEQAAFEFPVFDDAAFVKKEFKLAEGLAIAVLIAVVAGFLAWAVTVAGGPWWGSFGLGILLSALSPVLIGRVQPSSTMFTKGDWAGLIFLVFFGYLAIWLLLLDLGVR
jgi:hypothetical protein